VNGGQITSSPVPIPLAAKAAKIAAEPLDTANAYLAPVIF